MALGGRPAERDGDGWFRDWRLITWDPGTSAATVRDERGAGEALSVALAGTARESAVLSTVSFPSYDYQLAVVPLEGAGAPSSWPIASTVSPAFTALEPNRVYNTGDSRFYRTRPSLERTALPRSLADGRSPFAGAADYHTVILK
ncbi:MAG: hypothetical protein HYU51_19430 [Candidatus Rokubacteria bacterium]|nr:hypothetical protein [Candidatus Rokubacteria bacterium]